MIDHLNVLQSLRVLMAKRYEQIVSNVAVNRVPDYNSSLTSIS